MIYLLGFVIVWISRALIPTILFAAVALAVTLLLWLAFLRRRERPGAALAAWLAGGASTLGYCGWKTAVVWRDFSRPELAMFRDYIADPIPAEARNLRKISAAPDPFPSSANIRFNASAPFVRAIASHGLPGSKTLAVVERLKRESGRDPSDRNAVAGLADRSYVKVDPASFSKQAPEAFRWAASAVDRAHSRAPSDVYVLLLEGKWGTLQSVMTFESATETVFIEQLIASRRTTR